MFGARNQLFGLKSSFCRDLWNLPRLPLLSWLRDSGCGHFCCLF